MNEQAPKQRRVSPKMIAVGVIVVVLLLFWGNNRHEVEVDFVVFEANVKMWVSLVVAAVLGFVGGWLVARGRRKRD